MRRFLPHVAGPQQSSTIWQRILRRSAVHPQALLFPQGSTEKSGGVGAAVHEVAARFLIPLEGQQAALRGFFQQVVE